MTETPPRRPRPRRTFSAFGDVRRMPSEYEIVTHAQNWTLRQNRASAFEQNPSSAANLWFLTYRDNSPLRARDWDAFRDPDALTYKAYVNLQADAETKVGGVLEAHAAAGADATLDAETVALLGHALTPSRYLCHGFQQVQAYIGYMAPSSYITNAAAFATADFLRRVTLIAYRTRELQLARPDSGIGAAERILWEEHDGWQPARKAVEYALVTYDWAEAFTALEPGPRPDPGRRPADPARPGGQGPRRRADLAAHLVPGRRLPPPRPVEPGPGRPGRGPAPGEPRRVRQVDRSLVRPGRRGGPGLGSAPRKDGRGLRDRRRRARENGQRTVPRRAARYGQRERIGASELTMQTARWRETINLDDLWEGEMTAVTVDGEVVLLVNLDGTVLAYSNRCPHQASALDEGDLDGETLTCAKHLWEFNAATGCGINPDDAQLTRFGCQVGEDGTIYVDIGPR